MSEIWYRVNVDDVRIEEVHVDLESPYSVLINGKWWCVNQGPQWIRKSREEAKRLMVDYFEAAFHKANLRQIEAKTNLERARLI